MWCLTFENGLISDRYFQKKEQIFVVFDKCFYVIKGETKFKLEQGKQEQGVLRWLPHHSHDEW